MALQKVGPHLMGDSTQGRLWAANCNTVKALDDPGLFRYAKPGALLLFRKFFGDGAGQITNQTGAQAAAAVIGQLQGFNDPNLFIEGANEVVPWLSGGDPNYGNPQANGMVQYVAWTRDFVNYAHAHGYKVAGFSFGVGGPQLLAYSGGRQADDWKYIADNGFAGVDLIALHQYWLGGDGDPLDVGGFSIYTAARHVAVHDYLTSIGHANHPDFVLTEMGADVPGWKARGYSADHFAQQVVRSDGLLVAAPFVRGGAVFTNGTDPHWVTFQIDDLAPILFAGASPPPPPPSGGGSPPSGGCQHAPGSVNVGGSCGCSADCVTGSSCGPGSGVCVASTPAAGPWADLCAAARSGLCAASGGDPRWCNATCDDLRAQIQADCTLFPNSATGNAARCVGGAWESPCHPPTSGACPPPSGASSFAAHCDAARSTLAALDRYWATVDCPTLQSVIIGGCSIFGGSDPIGLAARCIGGAWYGPCPQPPGGCAPAAAPPPGGVGAFPAACAEAWAELCAIKHPLCNAPTCLAIQEGIWADCSIFVGTNPVGLAARCVDGHWQGNCSIPSDPLSGVGCAPAQQGGNPPVACVAWMMPGSQGGCVPRPCGLGCPGGAYCNGATGYCSDQPCGGPCPTGSLCEPGGGNCLKVLPCGGACPVGQTCDSVSNHCVVVPPCGGPCPVGQTCTPGPFGYACIAIPCTNGGCPTGLVCQDGKTCSIYVPPPPPCGGSCPSGQYCDHVTNTCMSLSQSPFGCLVAPCPTGTYCDLGTTPAICKIPCPNGCPTGQECKNLSGSSVFGPYICELRTCPTGYTNSIAQNKCVPLPCLGACTGGHLCNSTTNACTCPAGTVDVPKDGANYGTCATFGLTPLAAHPGDTLTITIAGGKSGDWYRASIGGAWGSQYVDMYLDGTGKATALLPVPGTAGGSSAVDIVAPRQSFTAAHWKTDIIPLPCGGPCPTGQVCDTVTGHCEAPPPCGGGCPSNTVCDARSGTCQCPAGMMPNPVFGSPGTTRPGLTPPPACVPTPPCGGPCPANYQCDATTNRCVYQQPAPACGGFCPAGTTCDPPTGLCAPNDCGGCPAGQRCNPYLNTCESLYLCAQGCPAGYECDQASNICEPLPVPPPGEAGGQDWAAIAALILAGIAYAVERRRQS